MDDMSYGTDTMVRWEYCFNDGPYKSNDVIGSFNKIGSEGWELVEASTFKRPYRICPDCDAKLVVGTETLRSAHDERCYRYGVAK